MAEAEYMTEPERIQIDPELSGLIPPLSGEERGQLEGNILAEGCRDPIVVWAQPEGALVLVDGHNRYAICTKHSLPFKTKHLEFESRAEAMDWMDANQLGRRNLAPAQMSLLRGRIYNRSKGKQGGTGANQYKQRGQNDTSAKTAETLASRHGVSAPTIKRDGQFAENVEKVAEVAPDIQQKVMSGEIPRVDVNEAAKIEFSSEDEAHKWFKQREEERSRERREDKRREVVERLESLAEQEAESPTGEYDVIVIDPPWPMQKIERDVRPNQVEFDYPVMSEEELAALHIPAAQDCHIWLWTTHKFMPMAFRLLGAWDMKYVCSFVWHKPGGFQPIGLPQYNCEFALYARKGSPKFVDTKAFPTCFNAPRGAHSVKPEEFYDLLRRVTAGRRLDMFNRREIEGFKAWGNEAAA